MFKSDLKTFLELWQETLACSKNNSPERHVLCCRAMTCLSCYRHVFTPQAALQRQGCRGSCHQSSEAAAISLERKALIEDVHLWEMIWESDFASKSEV